MEIERYKNEYTQWVYKRIYKLYNNIMTRCYNPTHDSYPIYGGKGVTVCNRWKGNFSNFLEDIDKIEGWDLEKYLNSKIQLDKDSKQKDVKNKVYSVETCRFVTSKENNNFREEIVEFYVVTPEGKIEKQRNLRNYCLPRGLRASHAGAMVKGSKERKSVKGYQFFDHYPEEWEINKRKTYKAISPNEEEIIFYKQTDLEPYGVTSSQVRRSSETGRPTKNGWLISKIQDGYTLL